MGLFVFGPVVLLEGGLIDEAVPMVGDDGAVGEGGLVGAGFGSRVGPCALGWGGIGRAGGGGLELLVEQSGFGRDLAGWDGDALVAIVFVVLGEDAGGAQGVGGPLESPDITRKDGGIEGGFDADERCAALVIAGGAGGQRGFPGGLGVELS
ncbi:MAG: hypothetical protein RI897_610 [Verrucomicrobiota bacterium]